MAEVDNGGHTYWCRHWMERSGKPCSCALSVGSPSEHCQFIVGEQRGEPVKCNAVRSMHGDALGMAAHEFVPLQIAKRSAQEEQT